MFEFAASGLFGSLLGGLFRLAPEVLKFFDKKNERNHEFQMFKLQTDLEKVRGEFKVEEKYVDFSIAQMDAIAEANKADALAASKSYRWVAALVASVRPTITYTIFGFYIACKIAVMSYGYSKGVDFKQYLAASYTPDDMAMLMMILTYWFLGRDINKYQKTV